MAKTPATAEVKVRLIVAVETQDAPNLGLATTRELMKELSARSRIHGEKFMPTGDLHSQLERMLNQFPEEFLSYKTVER